MRGTTDAELRENVGSVLSRFGIDKAEAKKAREKLSVRIGVEPDQEKASESDERYHIHFISHFSIVDLSIEDALIPTLTIAQQAVYRRLYRLSFGFGRNWCQASIGELQKQCNISARSTVRKAINDLQKAHCIKVISPPIQHKPPVYRVFLPCEMPQFEDVETGVLFLREKPDPGEFRGLDFRRLKNRRPNYRPLIFDSLDELRRLIFNPLKSKNRRLKIDPLDDNTSDNKGLDVTKNEEKTSINNLIKKSFINNSLSPDLLITSFYSGIGQKRVTREKRERAKNDLKELLEDGFSPDNIQFAIKWILANTKEELYDFSIIKHTIGQAMAAKKKTEAEEAKRIEAERIAAQERAEEKKRAEEEERIKVYKESLSSDERAKLRERAEAEIRDSGQFKEDFITDFLIEAKENKIVRREALSTQRRNYATS